MTDAVTPEEEGIVEPVSPWEQLKRDTFAKKQRAADFANNVRMTREVIAAEEEEANARSGLAETGLVVWGAGVDLVTESFLLAKEVQHSILPLESFISGAAKASGAPWGEKYSAFMQGAQEADDAHDASVEWLRAQADRIAPDNESLAGGISRTLLQYAVPYVGWAKAAGQASTFRAATARGFVIDSALFDPEQGNLSNLINELAPEQQNLVTEFLATDPDDSEALNRLRNGLEGAALGTVLEGIFRTARWAINARKVQAARARADASPDQMLTKEQVEELTAKQPEPTPEPAVTTVDDGLESVVASLRETTESMRAEVDARRADGSPYKTAEKQLGVQERKLAKMEAELNARAPKVDDAPAVKADEPAPTAPDAPAEEGSARQFFRAEHLRETLKLSAAQRKAFNEALLSGDDKSASQILELADFNVNTIDWENVSDPVAIKRLIATVSEVMADHIDDVKGGVQTHEQTQRLGNLVGFSAEESHKLFRDIRGDKGIAARFYAAKRTMMLGAREAERLIRESKADPSNVAKKSAVFRHLQLYSALQAEVKGAQSEIARALNAMKILTDDAGNGFREFDEIMKSFGGKHSGAKAFEKYMDGLLDALERGDIDGFNRGVRMTAGERMKNVVVEWVINAMLSSPKTHAINVMSNMLNTGLYSLDRVLAGAYRRLRHGDMAAWHEARLDLIHKFSSVGEAWKLAKLAWKEGAPITDKRQRLEFRTRQAISRSGQARDAVAGDSQFANMGERFNVQKTEVVRDNDGNIIAAVDYSMFDRAVNTIGRYVRIPGRALITGDEFFKTINRNAELNVLAFRQADDEAVGQGLKWGTKEYEAAVNKRIKTLLDPDSMDAQAKRIRSEVIEKARRVTFQESPVTDMGSKMEQLVNANAFFKLMFAPFFRTPMNILRQATVDRMPWGRFLDETKQVIKDGHPRARAEAEARMLTGLGAMTAAYTAISNTDENSFIEFAGKQSYDSAGRATGIKDYSIRIGEEWFQFNRLDPLGMWVGMMADVTQTVKRAQQEDESIAFALMQGALGTTMSNVINKTWFKSMADFLEFVEAVQKEGTSSETAQRAWGKFSGGQLGKFIPQLAKSVGKEAAELTNEDGETYAREAWSAWDNLMSQLPWVDENVPKRHDILGRPVRLNVEALNPFAHSDGVESPIEKELWRLNFRQQPMRRSYGSSGMPMSPEEYSKMTGMVNDPIFGGGRNLEEHLNALVTADDWEGKTRERKVYEIKTYIEAARSYATQSMLRDEGFRKRFADASREETGKLISK